MIREVKGSKLWPLLRLNLRYLDKRHDFKGSTSPLWGSRYTDANPVHIVRILAILVGLSSIRLLDETQVRVLPFKRRPLCSLPEFG